MIIHSVEQGTDEWLALRAAKPTSSEFSNLVTGTGKASTSLGKYALKLATEKKVGAIDDGFQGNKYTDRGHELEPLARADYAMMRDVEVQEVGFITDDLMRWGASTDGLVGDDGVVEFKNMIATRFSELLVYLAKNKGKTPPEYIPQVQGELFVTERDWCDLVFYNPQHGDPIILRHHADPEYHKLLKQQLIACITERDAIYELIKGDHNAYN